MDYRDWIDGAIGLTALIYLERVWKRHSEATKGTPERRTLYGLYFHTYPWAFWSILILILMIVQDARLRH